MKDALIDTAYALMALPFYVGAASWVGRLLKRRGEQR